MEDVSPVKKKRGRPPKASNPHYVAAMAKEQARAEQTRQNAELRNLEKTIKAVKRVQKAKLAHDNLIDYTEFVMPDPEDPDDVDKSVYKAAPFHRKIAAALEELERGEFTQLIFVMPPRHGKTQLATKNLAAWYSGRHPEQNIAVASYSDTMAEEMGADVRHLLTSKPHKQVFPGYSLRRGGTAKANIQTDKGGRLTFVGRGGALTGKGAHLAVGDDLFKDHEEARSQATRDAAWNWFSKVFMTRRMGKKLVILTFTRWHPDDIIGRITDPKNAHYPGDAYAKRWKIIRLPAIAEDDDPLGRKPGEPLWPNGPDKFDIDFLEDQRALDPLGFSSLYQQNPTVADGTLFQRKAIRFYSPNELPDDLRIYCASDHAVGTNQRNDPTCMIKVGVDRKDDIYLLDCVWRRMPSDQAVEAMLAMAGGNMRPIYWWAERGHISKSIGPFLYKRMAETGTYMNLIEVTPATDKEQRAQSIAARVAMGKVYFPKGPWWSEDGIAEMMSFPNGTHDDFVDALAYIGLGLGSQFGPATVRRNDAPREGTFAWMKKQQQYLDEKKSAKANAL